MTNSSYRVCPGRPERDNSVASNIGGYQHKGDGDAATWLPPNKSFRCEYVALQTAVKAKYGLWMAQAEHDAIAGLLTSSCTDQSISDGNGGASVPVTTAPEPIPAKRTEAPSAPEPPAPPAGVYFENCTAVREAGADPIQIGDPGWDTKFDGDGDGIGCE